MSANKRAVHVILAVDLGSRTVECRNCGTVPLRMKQGRAVCAIVRRQYSGSKARFAEINDEGYVYREIDGVVVLEHRWVMEQVLGRPLHDFENVHHKNGVRDDNDPDNLELWVTKQPKGQRPEELVAWAHEIIALYGGEPGA